MVSIYINVDSIIPVESPPSSLLIIFIKIFSALFLALLQWGINQLWNAILWQSDIV